MASLYICDTCKHEFQPKDRPASGQVMCPMCNSKTRVKPLEEPPPQLREPKAAPKEKQDRRRLHTLWIVVLSLFSGICGSALTLVAFSPRVEQPALNRESSVAVAKPHAVPAAPTLEQVEALTQRIQRLEVLPEVIESHFFYLRNTFRDLDAEYRDPEPFPMSDRQIFGSWGNFQSEYKRTADREVPEHAGDHP